MQCSCNIFRLCGKTHHTFMRVPKLLTEWRLAASHVDLSAKVAKELGPVEAVPAAVLGNLAIIIELVRKPRLLTENVPPVITLSRGKWAVRLPARRGSQ